MSQPKFHSETYTPFQDLEMDEKIQNDNSTEIEQSNDPPRLNKDFVLIINADTIRSINPALMKFIWLLIYYIVGIIFYHTNEGWDALDCIYYITVTTTTVGYGFFHPTHSSSKFIFNSRQIFTFLLKF